jgi:fructokinase
VTRLGVDLGGTKIAAVVIGPDGVVLWDRRVATPRHDYDATLLTIRDLVAAGEEAVGLRCPVGIGMPGAISPATGLVKNANSTWLNGRPLRGDLERLMARPLRIANDANCLAVSEAADGAAANADVVFGAILGTGTGGGIVVRGAVITGANAIAGEWGHNALPWPDPVDLPGPECYCGRRGCIETFLSGPGLASDHAHRSRDALTSEAIVARAQGGDAMAIETMAVWTRRLAKSLASVVNLLDPDVIVVGGGLSRIPSLYADVLRIWAEWICSDHVATRLVPAQHGDASGVRGAARLWDARPGARR